MEAGDEVVRLSRSLGEVFDLIVFHSYFGAKKSYKIVFLFEPLFQLLSVLSRDLSRQVGGGRAILPLFVVPLFVRDICRGMSRLVATSRDRSHLIDVGDVFCDRSRRDHVFFAEGRFHASAVEVSFGTISLNAARRAGKTGTGVLLQSLVNRESEIAVGARRDLSRLVVGHGLMIARLVGLSPVIPRRAHFQGSSDPDTEI